MVGEDRAGQRDGPRESDGTPPRPEVVIVRSRTAIRSATIASLVAVAVFGGLCGLLGFRLIQDRQAGEFRHELVEVAKQAAADLTTIDYKQVDADIQRILDSSTGAFYDDFKARSESLADVVRKAKSTSVGTVTDAGLIPDSVNGQVGQVLAAVTVNSTNDGEADEQPRHLRVRLTVMKVGAQAKVSAVEFVR